MIKRLNNSKKIAVMTLMSLIIGILFVNTQTVKAATTGKFITKITETYISSLGMLSLDIQATSTVGSIKVAINNDTAMDVPYKSNNKYGRAISGLKANDKVVLTAYDFDNKQVESLSYTLDSAGKLKAATTSKVSVTKVTIDKTTMQMVAGNSTKLSAKIEPSTATNKKVTWKTSNSKVATVDSTGQVKAVAAGTANITITSEDGKKTAICKVTVSAKAIPVSDLALTLTLKQNTTIGFGVLVNPTNATDKSVTWTSSNSAIASVNSSGNVTALKPGTATISAKTKDGKKSTSITVIIVK